MGKRNIAKLVRDDYCSLFEEDKKVERQTGKGIVETLYPHGQRLVYTKKGIWQIFERENFTFDTLLEEDRLEPSTGFVAAYGEYDETPFTLFKGEVESLDNKTRSMIDDTARILSENALDHNYSGPTGALKGVGVATLFLVYGAIESKLDIEGVWHHIFNYLKSTNNIGLATMVFTFSLFGGLAIVGGARDSIKRSLKDRKTVKLLEPEARSFSYGSIAAREVHKEYQQMISQARQVELYNQLEETLAEKGMNSMPRNHFQYLYNATLAGSTRTLSAFHNYLKENPPEMLHEAINLFFHTLRMGELQSS